MGNNVEYIFSINTGRSGSDYLSNLFSFATGCRAFHEAAPVCNGTAMRAFQEGNVESMRRLTARKVKAIKALKADAPVYVETNHLFIKSFGWFIPEHIMQKKIGIIVLRRNPEDVVKSFSRIRCTAMTEAGKRWILTPERRRPLVRPPTRLVPAHLFYKCMRSVQRLQRATGSQTCRRWLRAYETRSLRWYIRETDALARAYRERFPGICYYEVDVEDLNDLNKVEQMFDFFGCTSMPGLAKAVGRPTNLKRDVTD